MQQDKNTAQKRARERRLFFPSLDAGRDHYEFDSKEPSFHYLVNVLRVKPGQVLGLFDGDGLTAQASVVTLEKKRLGIEVQSRVQFQQPALQLHLYLGVSKGDRMDYALQKSTELGVTHITPVWTERSEVAFKAERLLKKRAHWEGVITSACEQSYQNFCPKLSSPVFLEYLELSPHPQSLILLLDPTGQTMSAYHQVFSANHLKPNKVSFFVGPEGGWSEIEISQLREKGAQPLQLGPRILRTETAPVVMLSLAQSLWGDFSENRQC